MNIKEKEIHTSSNGIGFLGLLTITFIILKLTGVINWSWFWVLSPIIIPIILVLTIIFISIILYAIVVIIVIFYSSLDEDD